MGEDANWTRSGTAQSSFAKHRILGARDGPSDWLERARPESDLRGFELANLSSTIVHSRETATWLRNKGKSTSKRSGDAKDVSKVVALNLGWLEWLMGLPQGWTALKSL